MRILLDECLPKKLKTEIPGHQVRTIAEIGFSSASDLALLRHAAGRFDAILTIDRRFGVGIVIPENGPFIIVLRARSNKIGALRSLLPKVMEILQTAHPGGRVEVRASSGT